MEDMLDHSGSSKSLKMSNLITGEKVSRKSLIASRPKGFAQKTYGSLVSLSHNNIGSGVVGHAAFFLVKVAALEIVRRFSKSRCPYAWRGIQSLQILCYPPFKWIQRWAPFKGLVKGMQILSRPLLVLSVATAFSDQSECSNGTIDDVTDAYDSEVHSELSSAQATLNTRACDEASQTIKREDWLIQLHKELKKRGICLPERINEDELRRFYTAANNDFSCFLSSIKKTINWRKTYRILSEEELQMWSTMVFWHGFDMMHRPCLVVRLGLACSRLASQDKPRFAQAVISQVERGVLYLVDAENTQITVLVDCEGLSPLGVPMQMLRSCSSLLQHHFPNRLGCLFVIRLPAVVRVIAQTFIQVLKPVTRKKLKIEGEMYAKVLNEFIQLLPAYLGGKCECVICSKMGTSHKMRPCAIRVSKIDSEADDSQGDEVTSPLLSDEVGCLLTGDLQKMIISIVGFFIFWVLIVFIVETYDFKSRPFMP
ncbi:Sec14 cytosolic factor [Quillaja saponaria]|uniref:Sec14 cytosolic factor n=1 Tax=Quillaja saponaria TaxID=32244 RepID=A0AAD7KXL2_QUISA|nr:Sec14 cytosolic factor [Quillaja saponaria]KAJ7947677.1 Sec14 cytosolic factor [Quillaja saponaria]